MAQAVRDENRVPSLLGTSSADGTTPVTIYADPTTHRLLVGTGFAKVDRTWAATGNTDVVTDANVTATSFVVIMNTTIPTGRWQVVCGSGSFTITSSDSENIGLAYSYKLI